MVTCDLENLDRDNIELIIKMMNVFLDRGLPKGELEEGVHWEYNIEDDLLFMTNNDCKIFVLDDEEFIELKDYNEEDGDLLGETFNFPRLDFLQVIKSNN